MQADLGDARYISVATFRRSGAEVKTPVWFAGAGDWIHVFTAGDSGKVKRGLARGHGAPRHRAVRRRGRARGTAGEERRA